MFKSALKMMAAPGFTVSSQLAKSALKPNPTFDVNKLASDPDVQKKLKSRRASRCSRYGAQGRRLAQPLQLSASRLV